MGLIGSLYSSSIGRKSVMAASGLLLAIFLLIHMLGNSTSFLGREAFNTYAERLHSLGILIDIFSMALFAVFLIHVITGLILFIKNLQARPSRYSANSSEGGRTWGSRTMPYTGAITLIFIVVHLFNFHFAEKRLPIADMVREYLSRPGPALFYIFCLLCVALHVSHGAWSLFQTMGFNREKYNRALMKGAVVFSIIMGTVFILIPFLSLISRSFLL